jgi:hypothetical protein
MTPGNLERMIALADEFFDAKNDPGQIAVDEEVMQTLRGIHPATMSEERDSNGPIAWVLVIPTSHSVMEEFLRNEIGEKALLDKSVSAHSYDSVYLCSALVLPEHRKKGIARKLALDAVRAIQADFPINALYCWAFSEEGKHLARSIAGELRLPIFQRD